MAEGKFPWGEIILKDAVRAATWGIVLVIIMAIFLAFIKQNIKEAIDFGAKRAVYETVRYATDPYLIGKGKQLIKEGVEYSIEKAGNKYREVIAETLRAAQTGSPGMKKE